MTTSFPPTLKRSRYEPRIYKAAHKRCGRCKPCPVVFRPLSGVSCVLLYVFWVSDMRIKDWEKFQHFKDRSPIWIKLYRTLLDDIEWHKLSGDDAKALVMIWLLASEKKGELPEVKELAFRLRMSETKAKQTVTKLDHYLIHSDDCLISECNQDDAAEKRRERDREEKRIKREAVVVAKKALEYLNSKAKKNYKETETNLSFILERIKEGYVLQDFQKAVDNQVEEWMMDEKMNKFLRPSTLFQKSKFDGYVNNNINIRSDSGHVFSKGNAE